MIYGWNPFSVHVISTCRKFRWFLFYSSIVKWITWFSSIYTASCWGQSVKMSFIFPSFNGAIPKTISSKYLMYIFTITGGNSEHRAIWWHILNPSWKNINISVRLSIGIQVRSSRKGSDFSQFWTTDQASFVRSLAHCIQLSNSYG